MKNKKVTKDDLKKVVNGKFENRIIEILLKVKKLTVNEIAETAKLDQPTTSIILSSLKLMGITKMKVKGKYREYSIDRKRYQEVLDTYMQIEITEKEKLNRLFGY